jgi:hypothetical protein
MAQITFTPSLLTIPPELRNLIFSFVLVADEPLAGSRELYSNRLHGYPTPHPLCRVSKQVRLEALKVFYGYNTFHFHTINGSPLKWYQQTSLHHSDGVNHAMRIILERDSICPPHFVTKLLLTQNREGEIKAAYLDEWAALCTCKLERWASEVSCGPAQPESLRLFSFADSLARGRRKWMICHKSEAPRRGEACHCGKAMGIAKALAWSSKANQASECARRREANKFSRFMPHF